MPTPTVTTKELSALEDQLSSEQTLITKYRDYAKRCQDTALQTKCNQIASLHQKHYDTLVSYLS
ncbi:MAG: spore coat protein [Clostridiales bacterium]|nr:spore coat protein [Clostridiales bacterium]